MDTSLQNRTSTEKRDPDAKESAAAPITKENILDYYDRAEALADKPSWTMEDRREAAAINGVASGGTAAVRELGEASATGGWGGYAKDVGLYVGIGAASGAAAQVVHNAISDILRSASISRQNKALIQQDMNDVRQRYEETVKALADPNATPEQRALLARSTVDNADWASRRRCYYFGN